MVIVHELFGSGYGTFKALNVSNFCFCYNWLLIISI